MTVSTLRLIKESTVGFRFRIRETVPTETPASSATVLIVAFFNTADAGFDRFFMRTQNSANRTFPKLGGKNKYHNNPTSQQRQANAFAMTIYDLSIPVLSIL
jgi:hypothetical protein